MNAAINIRIRAQANEAKREIAAVKTEITALQQSLGPATSAVNGLISSEALTKMARWGSQLQWAGRQLVMNFTAPLAAAGTVVTKWYLEVDAAMTQLAKVYDGAAEDVERFGGIFDILSEKYAVQKSEVAEIGAAWASAGAQQGTLLRGVEQTLKTMVLGDMKSAEAADAMIAITSQYGLTTGELGKAVEQMNAVENATGIKFEGLVQGMSRAAGVARTAGVDIEHLTALMAALVPASGGAEQAGNALKTMISRITSPTGDAAEIMAMMGINIDDVAWKSSNAATKIETMARAYHNLEGAGDGMISAQAAEVSAVVASRWNINRWDVMMRDVYNSIVAMDAGEDAAGFYGRALEILSDDARVAATAQQELATVLASDSVAVKRVGVVIQNSLMKVIAELMPQILAFIQGIGEMVRWFSNLDPGIQKAVLSFALLLAAIGPPIVVLGALSVAIGRVGQLLVGLANIPRRVAIAFGLMKTGATAAATEQAAAANTAAAAEEARVSRTASAAAKLRAIFASIAAAARASATGAAGAAQATTPMWMAAGTASANAYGTTLNGILAVQFGEAYAQYLRWLAMMQPPALTAGASAGAAFGSGISGGLVAAAPRVAAGAVPVITSVTGPLVAAGGAVGVATGGAMAAGTSAGFLARAKAIFAGIGAVLMRVVPLIRTAGLAIGAAILSPWTLAIAAVIGLLVMFRTQIGQIWEGIKRQFSSSNTYFGQFAQMMAGHFTNLGNLMRRVFNMLPESVQNAMRNVVNTIRNAAVAVYEWFSYINPFARHSPSLVENVTRGMKIAGDVFEEAARRIKAALLDAYNTLAKFGTAVANFMQKYEDLVNSQNIEILIAYAPETVGAYNELRDSLGPLREEAKALSEEIERQKLILEDLQAPIDAAKREVEALEAELEGLQANIDAAEAKVESMEAALDGLRAAADAVAAALEAAKEQLAYYEGASITGMRAMSDAMFENEMAQKRLQLAMMDWEDANGAIDDTKNNLASLQGEIEALRGQKMDLYMAGAGSDILGPIDAQIAEMQAAYDAMAGASAGMGGGGDAEYNAMKEELEALKRAGERLDLENSITFDPLLRELEYLKNEYYELPFDEIVAGITTQRAAVEQLEGQYKAANAAIEAQEGAIAGAKAEVEAAQKVYDDHQKKIDEANKRVDEAQAAYDAQAKVVEGLERAFQGVEEQIRASEEAMQALVSAAQAFQQEEEKLKKAKTPKADELSNFEKLAGGAFEDVGGTSMLANEDYSIDEFYDELMQGMGDPLAGMDPFGFIKDGWNSLVAWWDANVMPTLSPLVEGVQSIFRGVTFEDFGSQFDPIVDKVSGFFGTVGDVFNRLKEIFGPQIENIWAAIQSAWGPAIDKISEKIGPLWESIVNFAEQVGTAFQTMWTIAQPFLARLGAMLMETFSIIFRVIGNIIGPIIQWISMIIGNVIQIIGGIVDVVAGVIQIITSSVDLVIQFFKGLFTGDWSGFQAAAQSVWDGILRVFNGISDILGGIWSAVWNTIAGFIAVVVGAIAGFVQGIVDWFMWLWDVLVGNSIVPDMVNAIIDWFKNLWDTVVDFVSQLVENVVGFFTDLWQRVVEVATSLKDGVIEAWNLLSAGVETAWKWINDNVFTPIKDGIQWVVDKFVKAKDDTILAWGILRDKLVEWFNNVRDAVFEKVKQAIGWVVDKFTEAKDNIILVWGYLRDKLVEWFNNVRDGVFEKVKQAVGWVQDKFTDVKEKISAAWDVLQENLKRVGDWISSNVFDPLKNAVSAVGDAFDSTKDFIQTAWDKIANIARKPVNFIIETVYMKGIRAVWNEIADAVGLDLKLPSVSPVEAFASGSEDHRAQIAKAGAMRLWAEPETGGEAYIPLASRKRKRSTEILGAVANKFGYGLTQFENGGIVGTVTGVVGGAVDFVKDLVVNVADFLADPISGITNLISKPVEALMSNIGGGVLGQMMVEYPRKVIQSLMGRAQELAAKKQAEQAAKAAASTSGAAFEGTLAGWRRPSSGRITSQYGPRNLLGNTFHNGVDFAGGSGLRTYAANNGIVKAVGWNVGQGNSGIGIRISHGNGLDSYYGHNPSLSAIQVAAGDAVRAGQWIGKEGATGNVTGVHLHYSIFRGGKAINPAGYYDNGGWLQPGVTQVINKTRRPEAVLTGSQWNMTASMLDVFNKLAPQLNSVALDRLMAVEAMREDRRASSRGEETTVRQNRDGTAITFMGNLEFPNIKDPEDAKGLIRNLKDLAGV